jgi:hypothetical protein
LHADVYPWSHIDNIPVRCDGDVKLVSTEELLVCHRNLSNDECFTSSTERELLAIYHLLISGCDHFSGQNVTLHTDSQNAEVICTKGSPKPKLHAYAKLIHDFLENCKVKLTVRWIPRDLNLIADYISTEIDYADYEIVPEVYLGICNNLSRFPKVDRFASTTNAKCEVFFSAVFCPRTAGVDAFRYDWSNLGLNWIFVQPAVILRAVAYAQKCGAHILLLVPQWKSSHFYPVLMRLKNKSVCKTVAVFDGRGMFKAGTDKLTYFSDNYVGNVEVWELDFHVI